MRYSPYSQGITEIVRSGTLGQLVNVVHVEPVGYYHFAHSYVRGNWGNEKQSSFSLMTKSCQCVSFFANDSLLTTQSSVISTSCVIGFLQRRRLGYRLSGHCSTSASQRSLQRRETQLAASIVPWRRPASIAPRNVCF